MLVTPFEMLETDKNACDADDKQRGRDLAGGVSLRMDLNSAKVVCPCGREFWDEDYAELTDEDERAQEELHATGQKAAQNAGNQSMQVIWEPA